MILIPSVGPNILTNPPLKMQVRCPKQCESELPLELELEDASIQMNEDDSRRGKKQFCLFESPVVPKVKIELLLEVVDSRTFQ